MMVGGDGTTEQQGRGGGNEGPEADMHWPLVVVVLMVLARGGWCCGGESLREGKPGSRSTSPRGRHTHSRETINAWKLELQRQSSL